MKEKDNTDSIGWLYNTAVPAGGARKLVSLRLEGMEWVAIRTWIEEEKAWYDGSNREQAWVIAWKDLPATAPRNWVHGKLTPEFPESKYKDLKLPTTKKAVKK